MSPRVDGTRMVCNGYPEMPLHPFNNYCHGAKSPMMDMAKLNPENRFPYPTFPIRQAVKLIMVGGGGEL